MGLVPICRPVFSDGEFATQSGSESRPLDAAGVSGARCVCVSHQSFGDLRRRELHVGGELRAMSKNGVCAPEARVVARGHRIGGGAQRALHLRGAFRGAHGRDGAERHQHPLGRPYGGVLSRAFAVQGVDRRRGVFPPRRRGPRHSRPQDRVVPDAALGGGGRGVRHLGSRQARRIRGGYETRRG